MQLHQQSLPSDIIEMWSTVVECKEQFVQMARVQAKEMVASARELKVQSEAMVSIKPRARDDCARERAEVNTSQGIITVCGPQEFARYLRFRSV